MGNTRLKVITFAMMLSLFLASIESTVVATAMPTIVAQLGGLDIYAWVFSAYMLTSTTTMPIFGKLSDIYGRRRIYLLAVGMFLFGSILSGQAQDMVQLVLFRAIQGLGAGGVLPLAFTIIGDIFSFEQRAKMQGLFSGVWGLSSIVGPLVGGFLVEKVSWHWVFLLNVPFGLLAVALMVVAWREVTPRQPGQVDYAGAGLLASGVGALLLALFKLAPGNDSDLLAFLGLFGVSIFLLVMLALVERRAANPILPLHLIRDRLYSSAVGHGFLAGFALFGSTSFIPLFVQLVLGASATAAGATLTPQLLGWTTASIIGTRLLLRFNYRSLALTGMSALVIGFGLLSQVSADTNQWFLIVSVAICGIGMGLSVPSFLIAVQTSVPRQSLGTATSTLQFSRSIGGTVGVSVMGLVLATRLSGVLLTSGLDPAQVSVSELLDVGTGAQAAAAAATLEPLRVGFAFALQGVFVAGLIAATLGWVVTALAPNLRIGKSVPVPSAEQGVVE